MKKKFCLSIFIGMMIGILFSIGVYFLTVGEVAWEQYLEEKLVPAATATISSLLLIYFGVAPVLKKVINTTLLFNKAADNVNATVQNGKEANNSIEQFKQDIAKQINEAVESGVAKMKEQDERIKRIELHSSNTEAILRIGFGNTEELVKKGYASEIAKVGVKNEEDET